MKIVRPNANRDENKPPSVDDCLAHRCEAHRDMPPVDDSEESSGAECGICVGHKFVALIEEKTEEDILDRLYWPIVETARARLNLLARGAGDALVDEARQHMDQYRATRTGRKGEGYAETHIATATDARDRPTNSPGD